MGSRVEQPWRGDAPEWMQWSNCRDTDPDVFFPEAGGSADPAKRICGNCPVEYECFVYAMDRDERFGVWGGTSEPERRRLKRWGRQP